MSERDYPREVKSLTRLSFALAGLAVASVYTSYEGHKLVSSAIENTNRLLETSRECTEYTEAALAQRDMKIPCSRETIGDFERAGDWIAGHSDEIIGSMVSVCYGGESSCPADIGLVSDVEDVVSDAYFYCPDRDTYADATSADHSDSTCAFVIVDHDGECDYSSRPTEIYMIDCALDYDMCGKVRVLVHEALHAIYCVDHPKDAYGNDRHDDWIYAVGDKASEVCRAETL